MLRTNLVHFAGRMQWVPKEDEALNIGAGCTNLRSDSSTHRLAANHQRARPIFFSRVVSTTARKHASSLLFVSGTRRPCSVYRQLKHAGPWDALDANGHFGPGSTSKTNGGDHSKFLQLAEAPQSAPAKAAVMSVHRFFRKLMKSGPTADRVVRLNLARSRFGARRTRQPISVSKRTLAGLPTARLLFQKYYTGSIMPESSSPRPQTLTRFDPGHTAPHGQASCY